MSSAVDENNVDTWTEAWVRKELPKKKRSMLQLYLDLPHEADMTGAESIAQRLIEDTFKLTANKRLPTGRRAHELRFHMEDSLAHSNDPMVQRLFQKSTRVGRGWFDNTFRSVMSSDGKQMTFGGLQCFIAQAQSKKKRAGDKAVSNSPSPEGGSKRKRGATPAPGKSRNSKQAAKGKGMDTSISGRDGPSKSPKRTHHHEDTSPRFSTPAAVISALTVLKLDTATGNRIRITEIIKLGIDQVEFGDHKYSARQLREEVKEVQGMTEFGTLEYDSPEVEGSILACFVPVNSETHIATIHTDSDFTAAIRLLQTGPNVDGSGFPRLHFWLAEELSLLRRLPDDLRGYEVDLGGRDSLLIEPRDVVMEDAEDSDMEDLGDLPLHEIRAGEARYREGSRLLEEISSMDDEAENLAADTAERANKAAEVGEERDGLRKELEARKAHLEGEVAKMKSMSLG